MAQRRFGSERRSAQNPFATCMKKSLTDVPTKAAQPTTMIEMNAAIRAYSIDVAPERPIRNGSSATRIRSIITVIPVSVLPLPVSVGALLGLSRLSGPTGIAQIIV
jgi:hypothetical protein